MAASTRTPPATAAQIDHFFAASADAWASSWRPCIHSESTSPALTSATMPSGRQHITVARIAHTRLLSGGGP